MEYLIENLSMVKELFSLHYLGKVCWYAAGVYIPLMLFSLLRGWLNEDLRNNSVGANLMGFIIGFIMTTAIMWGLSFVFFLVVAFLKTFPILLVLLVGFICSCIYFRLTKK